MLLGLVCSMVIPSRALAIEVEEGSTWEVGVEACGELAAAREETWYLFIQDGWASATSYFESTHLVGELEGRRLRLRRTTESGDSVYLLRVKRRGFSLRGKVVMRGVTFEEAHGRRTAYPTVCVAEVRGERIFHH